MPEVLSRYVVLSHRKRPGSSQTSALLNWAEVSDDQELSLWNFPP